MKPYSIKSKDKVFRVIENKTGLILKMTPKKTEAETLLKCLDNGSGFHGETPAFLAAKNSFVAANGEVKSLNASFFSRAKKGRPVMSK